MRQISIKSSIKIDGINLFNGRKSYVIFHPSDDNTGLNFRVKDELIPVKLENAYIHKDWRMFRIASCIAIHGKKEKAIKVEHLLSSVYSLGIDNLIIELSDGVCPRQNNSVSEFIENLGPLRQKGNANKSYLTLREGLSLEERTVVKGKQNDKLIVQAAEALFINYLAYFPHKAVGEQHYRLEFTEENYKKEIMPARGIIFLPFGSRNLFDIIKYFYGISDSNALLIGSKKQTESVNKSLQKHVYVREEFVKHKILDAIGALALTGKWFKNTEFKFDKTGHEFDIYSIRTLLEREIFVNAYQ